MTQSIPLDRLRSDTLLQIILEKCRTLAHKPYKIEDAFSCPEKAVLWLRDMSNFPFTLVEEPSLTQKINPELKNLLGDWL